jgi:hypothetical protein
LTFLLTQPISILTFWQAEEPNPEEAASSESEIVEAAQAQEPILDNEESGKKDDIQADEVATPAAEEHTPPVVSSSNSISEFDIRD